MKKITLGFTKPVIVCLFLIFGIQGFSQCSDQFTQGTSQSNGSGYNWADAFIASCSGNIEYVQFYSGNAGTVAAGTLKIYNGAGVSTTPVYTQSYPSFPVADGGPVRVDLTGEFHVTAGTQYTFSLYISGSEILYYPSFSVYPGGGSWQNGTSSYKHNFKVGILGELANETFDVSDRAAVFPNPSTGSFAIQLNQTTDITVEIYNIVGERIFSGTRQQSDTYDIDITGTPAGIYFVMINDGEKIETQKLVIQ